MFKVITGTLQANHNTMQLTDDTITNDSIFEVYADTENVIPSSVSVGGHTVTITFDSKPSNNVGIKVLINNIVGEFAPDSINAEDVSYTNTLLETNNVKDTLDIVVENVNDIDTELHKDTVLGGVLYNATSGIEWKRLSGSDVDYDDNTTINEKLDAVFQSVSNGKSIIASAITDKGVPTLAADTFQTMADHIAEIECSGGIVQHEEYYGNAVGLYNKTITSQLTGTFRAIIYSFTDTSMVIKKNNVVITAIFSDTRSSVHHYSFYEFEVEKDDSINFSISNNGDNSFCLGWYITDGTSAGTDVSDTTAIASDVLFGKVFYNANGERTLGILEPLQIAYGSVTVTTSSGTTVDVGFRPRFIVVIQNAIPNGAPAGYLIYNYYRDSREIKRNNANSQLIPNTTSNYIGDITDTGFTLNKVTNGTTIPNANYWAIG